MKLHLQTVDFAVSKEQFELYYDASLEMLVTSPVPSSLDKYYDSEGYISHTDANNTWFDRLYQRIKRKNLKSKMKIIESYKPSTKSLLDIGAGTGDFVLRARAYGYDALGVEPNKKAQAIALRKGAKLHLGIDDINHAKFKVITLWHVLEHLPNLDKQIGAILSKLDANGILVIAVPNFNSFDAKYYGKYWAGYDVPRHLWHFSQTSIEKIFEKHNVRVDRIIPMWFDAFYVSLLSEKYKKSNFQLVRAFIIGLLSNISALFSKEHSSLIFVLKKKNEGHKQPYAQ